MAAPRPLVRTSARIDRDEDPEVALLRREAPAARAEMAPQAPNELRGISFSLARAAIEVDPRAIRVRLRADESGHLRVREPERRRHGDRAAEHIRPPQMQVQRGQ